MLALVLIFVGATGLCESTAPFMGRYYLKTRNLSIVSHMLVCQCSTVGSNCWLLNHELDFVHHALTQSNCDRGTNILHAYIWL